MASTSPLLAFGTAPVAPAAPARRRELKLVMPMLAIAVVALSPAIVRVTRARASFARPSSLRSDAQQQRQSESDSEAFLAATAFPAPSTHPAPSPAFDIIETDCTSTNYSAVMGGTDVVAYFEDASWAPVTHAEDALDYVWADYTWSFTSAEHRESFVSEPTKFLPAWGGFCAWGICCESVWTSDNLGPPPDPQIFSMIDGRLFVFENVAAQDKFLANTTEATKTGDERWEGWFGRRTGSHMNTKCVLCDPTSAPSSAPAPHPPGSRLLLSP